MRATVTIYDRVEGDFPTVRHADIEANDTDELFFKYHIEFKTNPLYADSLVILEDFALECMEKEYKEWLAQSEDYIKSSWGML